MYLRWEYLIGCILFFCIFLFDPLLKAVGPQQTTYIVCIGLVCVTVVKIAEYFLAKPELMNDDVSNDDD